MIINGISCKPPAGAFRAFVEGTAPNSGGLDIVRYTRAFFAVACKIEDRDLCGTPTYMDRLATEASEPQSPTFPTPTAPARFVYAVVAVRLDAKCREVSQIEALCLSPERARELFHETVVAGDEDGVIRVYVSINEADTLGAFVEGSDNLLETTGRRAAHTD